MASRTREGLAYSKGVAIGMLQLEWLDNVWLTPALKDAWLQMKVAAAKDGVILVPSFGFRFHDQQRDLYNARMDQPGDSEELLRNKKKIRELYGIAARPGYSLHQSGHALDIRVGLTPKDFEKGKRTTTFNWLEKNAHRFGFKVLQVASEPWHLELEVK